MLGITAFFADPYSAWPKGAVENERGLIRSTCLKEHFLMILLTEESGLLRRKSGLSDISSVPAFM
jgi:IS30 family transposase